MGAHDGRIGATTMARDAVTSGTRVAAAAAVVLVALAVAACGAPPVTGGNAPPGVVRVVAAEDFWGSIAAQVGGSSAHVASIITNPDVDPHAYEPTAADARAVASAGLVIENGIGYDPWMAKLVAADGSRAPMVLDVGALLHVPAGGNPHRWYDPVDVRRVVAAIAADLARLDPSAAGSFAAGAHRFESVGLARYDALVAAIRSRYAGTPVGASESIFAMLAPALGLRLVTPPSFLRAVSEGSEVSAADIRTIDHQIRSHAIAIYVLNSQNVTPEVQAQLALARAEHIPVATITETLVPAGATYQAWQVAELEGIEAALARAARR
jgi:zinc/manganese transport system substrate-binding protein